MLFKQGEIEKAAKYVRMAVELKPDYAAAYYLQGKIQETKREFGAAAHSYARAIELEPGHINAHYQLGLLYPRLGQPEEGRRQTAIFQSLKSRVDAINAVILGTNFLRAGKYRLAEENFARAVASDPHDPQALYYLGAAQQMEGESAKAIDSYRKSLAANSRVAIVHAELGLLLAQLGHADDALPHLKQALELKKDDFAVALAVGRGFLLLEHYSEAEGPLLRAFQLWPSEGTVVVILFQMYARWGKNDQAAHYVTLAIKAHPEDAHLYYLAALSWAAQQNFAQAIENLRRAVRLSPDFAAAYLKLAWVYYETQQAPLALDAVDRHLRLEPRSGEGHFLKARLQLEKGNLPEALQEARLASQFSSRDPEVFLLLSQVCRRLDRIEE